MMVSVPLPVPMATARRGPVCAQRPVHRHYQLLTPGLWDVPSRERMRATSACASSAVREDTAPIRRAPRVVDDARTAFVLDQPLRFLLFTSDTPPFFRFLRRRMVLVVHLLVLTTELLLPREITVSVHSFIYLCFHCMVTMYRADRTSCSATGLPLLSLILLIPHCSY